MSDKEEQKHTPTPWSLYTKLSTAQEPYSIIDADGAVVAVVLWTPNVLEPEDSLDNARFIIRAVNNHTALVEALQLLQGFNWRLDDSAHGQEIKRRAELALEAATRKDS